MKDKNKNSRIKFTYEEVEVIKKSLDHWVLIDTERFCGSAVHTVQPILDFIKIRTLAVKDEYTLNLNCQQLSFIHGAVAEEYLDYKRLAKHKAIHICKHLEEVMRKNYKLNTTDICHPCSCWQ